MFKARLVAPKTFEIIELPTPEPKEGEVLLRVDYVGICGSEFASYLGLATEYPIYEHRVSYPRFMGHEAACEVVAVGPGVTSTKVGDRVVPRRAHYATHHIAKAAELKPVPEGVSQKSASLALMAQETYYVCNELAKVRPEDKVLIVGLGPFGMLCLEHLREIGCAAVAAVDLVPGRLVLAQELGATHTWNAGTGDLVEAIPALLGEAPTVVIDTTGQEQPMLRAFKLVAPEGKLVLAGRPHAVLNNFEIEDIFHRMITVFGGKTPPAGYDARYTEIALDLIRRDKVHAGRHITHEFPLRRIGEGFEMATHPDQGGLKIVINCQEP